jgi:predicted component of type VI protein secretion system
MPLSRPRADAISGYCLSVDDEELVVPRDRELLIGRASDCALQLRGGLVSRHHARLMLNGGGLIVEDLQSRNGVTVNSVRICGAALLGYGDVIGVGLRSILVFDAAMNDRAEHLSTLPPAELANAIALRDKAAVTRTPGVGPKVAERIVTELKDKVPAFANVDPALVHLSGAIDDHRAPRPVTDAISALVNLGYGPPQAAAAIAAASRSAGEKAETAQLIRLGLKELAK